MFGHRRRAEQGTIRSVFSFSFFAFFPHEDLEGAVKSFERHTCTEPGPAWEREENFCLTSDPLPRRAASKCEGSARRRGKSRAIKSTLVLAAAGET